MEIVRKSERAEEVTYSLKYAFRNNPQAGFTFECDSVGNPFALTPIAEENLIKCVNGTHDVTFEGITEQVHSYSISAIGICVDCGEEVHLTDEFLNSCVACGSDYDGSGECIEPRSHLIYKRVG